MRKVLNVGGNSKEIPIPAIYAEWEHLLLDIDPRGEPDVVCDARLLHTLPPATYDAVYCSHNLEHYYAHEVPKVLAGFLHVLNDTGFAHIRVPDMGELMRRVVQQRLDIEDILYETEAGLPILVRDVIYGYGVEIERSGNDFFAHKTGFTKKSLQTILQNAGFYKIFTGTGYLEIVAFAFKQKPTPDILSLLRLPTSES